ncbi:MAG TPA: hypothetical protein VFR97_01685 [Capillimicrobium sp.]|nr:hypothetical protein [Capillimicrobium sp.]
MRSILIGAAACAALALTACGGDGGGEAAATAGDPDQARLEWARCMREHGVDVPDPDPDGRIEMRLEPGSQAQMERAQEACRELQEAAAPPLSEEERTELYDAAVEFSQCMREHGVDMPDPQQAEGGGILMRMPEGGRMPDMESPAFQRAQEACEDLMPKRPGA